MKGPWRIHFGADHFSPRITGHAVCVAPMSMVPSGLSDQKRTASPARGLTARERRAQSLKAGPLSPLGAWAVCGVTGREQAADVSGSAEGSERGSAAQGPLLQAG